MDLPSGLAGLHDQREAFLSASQEASSWSCWAPFKSWWLYQYVLPVLTRLKGVFSRLSQVIVLGDMLSYTVSQPRSWEHVAPNCCLPLGLNC